MIGLLFMNWNFWKQKSKLETYTNRTRVPKMSNHFMWGLLYQPFQRFPLLTWVVIHTAADNYLHRKKEVGGGAPLMTFLCETHTVNRTCKSFPDSNYLLEKQSSVNTPKSIIHSNRGYFFNFTLIYFYVRRLLQLGTLCTLCSRCMFHTGI